MNAPFLIQPKLFCGDKLIPLSHLKDVVAEIETVNFAGVKNSREYKDQILSYETDLVLPYMIPPKTRSITISIRANIKSSIKDQKDIPLSWSSYITLGERLHTDAIFDSYIKRSTEGYIVQVLGKDGEPYKDQKVVLNLTQRWGTDQRSETL